LTQAVIEGERKKNGPLKVALVTGLAGKTAKTMKYCSNKFGGKFHRPIFAPRNEKKRGSSSKKR